MTWTHPVLLAAAPLALAVLFWLQRARGARVRRLFVALGGSPERAAERSGRLPALLAAGCVGLGLAGPVLSEPGLPPEGSRSDGTDVAPARASASAPAPVPGGVEVVLAVDVSRSMAALDGAPDRISAARMAALRVATLEAISRVGLVAFAAAPHLLVPPTADRGLVLLHLDGLTPDALTAQGTDLAAALESALDALVPAGSGTTRAVVLVSDGEGFQDQGTLDAALARAGRERVAVHTVAVGSAEGAPVPGRPGETTRAQPEALGRIARGTGGMAAVAGGEVAPLLADVGRAREAPGPNGLAGPTGGDVTGRHLAPGLALVALLALLADLARGGGGRRRAA